MKTAITKAPPPKAKSKQRPTPSVRGALGACPKSGVKKLPLAQVSSFKIHPKSGLPFDATPGAPVELSENKAILAEFP